MATSAAIATGTAIDQSDRREAGSGLHHRADDFGTWAEGSSSEWVTARPAPALRPYVEQYAGYRQEGFAPGIHRGLPSRRGTFILSIGAEIDVVAQTDPRQAPGRYRVVLGALQATPTLIAHEGRQEGIAVDLTPLGWRALFGCPGRELWDIAVEVADVVGRSGDRLWEQVHERSSWTERFATCDDVLTGWLREPVVAPELLRAWELIVRSGGTVSVGDLANDVGWSRQHLTRRFNDEFGLRPKLLARIVRFERACGMLRSTPSLVSVAQVAAACGYYDQAHLDRDFTALAGCSPTRWLADEVPSVQDGAVVDLPSSSP